MKLGRFLPLIRPKTVVLLGVLAIAASVGAAQYAASYKDAQPVREIFTPPADSPTTVRIQLPERRVSYSYDTNLATLVNADEVHATGATLIAHLVAKKTEKKVSVGYMRASLVSAEEDAARVIERYQVALKKEPGTFVDHGTTNGIQIASVETKGVKGGLHTLWLSPTHDGRVLVLDVHSCATHVGAVNAAVVRPFLKSLRLE